jgi:hypothetical protein
MQMNKPANNPTRKASKTSGNPSIHEGGKKPVVVQQERKEDAAFEEWLQTEHLFERFNSQSNPVWKTLAFDA